MSGGGSDQPSALRLRSRSRKRARTLFVVCLAALASGSAFPQSAERTSQEEMGSNNPRVFDTEVPAAYGGDYPALPDSDPFVGISGNPPPPVDILSNPDRLFEFQSRAALLSPSPVPSDYDPNNTFSLAGDRQYQPAYDYPTMGQSALVLGDLSHPALYRTSEATLLYDMQETPVGSLMPFIPVPTTVFERPPRPQTMIGPVRFSVELEATAGSVSNVFGTTTDPKNDTVFTFNPKIYLEAGTRGFVSFFYGPSLQYYSKYKTMDADNQMLAFTIRYPFSKLQIGADVFYTTQSGLFVNSQTSSAQQATYIGRLFASYPLTEKSTALFFYEGTLQDTDPGGRKTENSVKFVLNHTISPFISVGASLMPGRVDARTAKDTYVTLQLQFTWVPEYHFQFRGEGGIQYRDMSPGAGGSPRLSTPVFDITGSYHATANTALVLRFYKMVNDNTFEDVNVGLQTGVELSLLFRFLEKTDFALKGGAGYVEQLSSFDPVKSNFSFLQGGMKLTYSLIRDVDLILFDNIQQRFADSLGGNYVSNTIGAGITVRF